MTNKKKELSNIIGGELIWAVLWGVLMLVSLGIFASTCYTLGYESGVHNGIESAMAVQPVILKNDLDICNQNLDTCQTEQERAVLSLQLCQEKLVKVKKLVEPYAICVKDFPAAGLNQTEYENSGMIPISCSEHWRIYREVFG